MSKIKENFISRFEGGSIIEMDFSQLEVIGLAILSRDPQLWQDLAHGLDLHCVNTASLYNESYVDVKRAVDKNIPEWVEKRKTTKPFSFQLQYGAGAKSMAEDNACTVKFAQKFIDGYFNRYPRVKQWQEENIELVKEFADISTRKTKNRVPAREGWLQSPTGRTYQFHEYDAPQFLIDKGVLTSFSPTQIKNYPVQGFSTGDVVPLALGRIIRWIVLNGLDLKIKLIGTVHDSILFDVPSPEEFGVQRCKRVSRPPCIEEDLNLFGVLGNLRGIMVSIVDEVNKLWPEVQFNLPLNVDVQMGYNWGTLAPLNLKLKQWSN